MRSRVLGASLGLLLLACGSSLEGDRFEVPGSGRDSGGSSAPELSDPASGPAPTPGGAPSAGGDSQVQAGTLTAGLWDDNLNFAWFERYRDSLAQEQGLPPFEAAEQRAAAEVSVTAHAARTALDVAFVIDTTGSMGDEIRYLQAEFHAIAQRIVEEHPGVEPRWALIAYRDTGDAYVLRGNDFARGVSWFQGELAKLSAGGGGDFPEAPDQALAWAASKLSWSDSQQAARLLFWVADAPHHGDKAGDLADAVRALRAKDVHVYPVASSGVDELTEYTMRAAAQLTAGRYLFLTDDSGVGGEHKTPSTPCYVVTRLDVAMLRAVSSELSGARVAAEPASVLRTVGEPEDGVCSLQEGEARLF